MLYSELVRPATATEMEIYERVEANMSDALWEAVMDYADCDGMDTMCDGYIESEELVAMIEAEGFTVSDICTWFYID